MDYDHKAGQDECNVYLTGGSNGAWADRHLGTFTAADLGKAPAPSVTSDEVAEVVKNNKQGVVTEYSTDFVGGRSLVTDLANLFENKDPQFDRERFLAACGID